MYVNLNSYQGYSSATGYASQGFTNQRVRSAVARISADADVQDPHGVGEPSSKMTTRRELAEQLRGIYQTQVSNENPYMVSSDSLVNSLWGKSDKTESEEEKLLANGNDYNFKEVSSKIQRAKTSLSAGQAVLAAKRKVLELKRKLVSGDGDSEEIQSALTHARKMELVAKRKKRHLELEEMVVNTQKQDEVQDKTEQAASEMQAALAEIEDEKVFDKQAELAEQQTEMLAEAAEEVRERGEEFSEELAEELNEFTKEFGDEEMEMLEEMSEMLESMEILDPHMSAEDLEKLKTKHRNAENKEMMKADMDYLKEVFDRMEKSGGSAPGIGSGFSSAAAGFGGIGISAPAVSASAGAVMPSFDASV